MNAQIELDYLRIAAPAVIGKHRTTCPHCSAYRAKSGERCLSVRIEPDAIEWRCHHCGWEGFHG